MRVQALEAFADMLKTIDIPSCAKTRPMGYAASR